MRAIGFTRTVLLAGVTLALLLGGGARAEDEDYARWYFSPGVGMALTEGDQPLDDGLMLNLRLGYDWNEWWSFEAGWLLAPKLDEQYVGHEWDKTRGYTPGEKESQADSSVAGFGDTWMSTIYADALFHFTRWERLDPYLAAGLGLVLYGEDVLPGGKAAEAVIRGGGGVIYHLSDEWALRADARMLVSSDNLEINAQADVGVVWTWGAGIPPAILATDGPLDSDGDGLFDVREGEIGTDPFDPDSDDDGLTDGQEVNTYKTDPLNPDSDYDLLKDGAEVLKHKTDPLDRDTDDGGVYDGHEVLEDNTNPLVGADDLMMFELYLQFDYDKSVVKQQYFDDLDVIVKVLKRHPEATAVIEGHADRLTKSKAGYNRTLSERRARAVLAYISGRGVAAGRMRAVGYGFDRPKAAVDLIKGTPANRRVEVFIAGVDRENILRTLKSE